MLLLLTKNKIISLTNKTLQVRIRQLNRVSNTKHWHKFILIQVLTWPLPLLYQHSQRINSHLKTNGLLDCLKLIFEVLTKNLVLQLVHTEMFRTTCSSYYVDSTDRWLSIFLWPKPSMAMQQMPCIPNMTTVTPTDTNSPSKVYPA